MAKQDGNAGQGTKAVLRGKSMDVIAPEDIMVSSNAGTGYACPFCDYEAPHAVSVWHHLHFKHKIQRKSVKLEREAQYACCDRPKYRFLGHSTREKDARAAGYNEICVNCEEVR